MLTNIQKLAFSFSVIVHAVAFYPYQQALTTPSDSKSRLLSFSLVSATPSNKTIQPEPEIQTDSEMSPENNVNIAEQPLSVSDMPHANIPEPIVSQVAAPEKIKKTSKKKIVSTDQSIKQPSQKPQAKPLDVPEKTQVARLQTAQSQPLVTTLQVAEKKAIRQDYLELLIEKINANKFYPKKAKRRGWQGEVIVTFSVMPSGQVENVEIIKASNFKVLNKSALRAIYDSVPFEPIPDNLGLTKLDLELPIIYQLH